VNVLSDKNLKAFAAEELRRLYTQVEDYIRKDPFYGVSYEPVKVDAKAQDIVKSMASSSERAEVGPMAAVAGAIAEFLGQALLRSGAREVVVENGGDIYLKLVKEKKVGVHAGESAFSNKLAFKVKPEETPLGICTSAATVGHSVSLGEADAVVAVSKSTPLADAAATAIANEVKGREGVKKAIKKAREIKGLCGVLIIKGDELATWGELPELVGVRFKV
jgi:ApbE superfamily uncharacterized protein (UPF0280 family)